MQCHINEHFKKNAFKTYFQNIKIYSNYNNIQIKYEINKLYSYNLIIDYIITKPIFPKIPSQKNIIFIIYISTKFKSKLLVTKNPAPLFLQSHLKI